MKSKIAPFLISLLFLFSCGKSPAKEEKGSLIYQVDEKDGVAMVSGYSGSLSQESVLSEYKGYPVTSIGPSAFEDCSSLRSLSLPLSITSIGSRAFYQCSSLSEMNLPTSLLSIGTEAFSWCVSLSEIVIPSSLSKIEDKVFYCCSSLEKVDFSKSSVSSIGIKSFSGCGILGNPIGPSSLASFPSSLTSIGSNSFYGTSITSLAIPDGVVSIGDRAFADCLALKKVSLGSGKKLTSIGEGIFSGDYLLSSLTVPFVASSRNLSSSSALTCFGYFFGSASFKGASLVSQYYSSSSSVDYYVPDALSTVEVTGTNPLFYGAFYGCSSLASINLPSTISSIVESAFYGCSSISKLTLPADLKTIGGYAFYGCSAIDKLTLPSKLKTIGD